MQTFGVGIIGFGFIGRAHAYGHITLPVYCDPPPCKTRLVGVATSRPETAEAARQSLGFEFATTDWRELIDRPDIDIIHICTPNNLHKNQVLTALAAGKHVYCDKPLCMNTAEADEIAVALPGTQVTHQMVLQNRFFPSTMRAKQMIEDGFLGDLLSFRAAFLHSGSADPNAPLKWKLDTNASGGGVIFDLGSHVLDLMQFLIGPLAIENCTTHIAYTERPLPGKALEKTSVVGEDAAFMTVRSSNGTPGIIEASKIATGALDSLRFEIHGNRGALRYDLMEPSFLWIFDATLPTSERGWRALETVQSYPSPVVFPPSKVTIGWVRGHAACLHNFLTAVAEGRPADPGLEVGVQLQHLMAEAYAHVKST